MSDFIADPKERGWYNVGLDLWVAEVRPEDLKEQPLNAQVMPPTEFDRLVANIKERGALESMPYCNQPHAKGPIEIISGHHRNRAAKAAGLKTIHVLVDTQEIPRSKSIAKVLAHNQLVGKPITDIVKEMLKQITNPEDLLLSGVKAELLPTLKQDESILFAPTIALTFKTVVFTFLSHQAQNLKALVESIPPHADATYVAMESQWKEFLTAATAFAKLKEIRSAGTAIALLTEMALAELKANDATKDRQEGPESNH